MSFLPKIQLFPFCLSLLQEYLHLFVKLHKIKVYSFFYMYVHTHISRYKVKEVPQKKLVSHNYNSYKKS